ncbi:alanine/glycine:cation symporter family protein [Thermaurantiacus sp.]
MFVDLVSRAIELLSAIVFFEIVVAGVPVQLIVLWLALAMVFATVWLGVPQLRGFALGWGALFGKRQDPGAPGGVSQFQALSTALASTVGLGNIAGVAVAVATGGPGAIFWMVVIGFFAMALKCAEVTLGLMYRDALAGGRVVGGPAVTLMRGLASVGLPRTGRHLARFHALFMIVGCMSLFQVNQAQIQAANAFHFEAPLLYGLGFAILVAVVLLGSIGWIGRVTGRLVPAMCLLYVAACLAVILANLGALPAALARIFVQAFEPLAVAGGAVGVFIVGMRRAVYSSEAGIGTAVVAHSQARTHEPASEGMVALIEPFIDTVVICTLSGLTLVVTGMYTHDLTGVAMTSAALATVIPGAPALLAIVVFLFAYSTVLANGFYAAEAFQFLTRHGRWHELGFKTAYCAALPLGALLEPGQILDLVDSAFFLMALPNVLGIYLLARPLRREVNGFLARQRGAAS